MAPDNSRTNASLTSIRPRSLNLNKRVRLFVYKPKKKYIYYFFQTTITLRFQMIYLWKQDLLSIVEIKPYTEKYINIFTYISIFRKSQFILENRRIGAVTICV